jgi:hypothetical protein
MVQAVIAPDSLMLEICTPCSLGIHSCCHSKRYACPCTCIEPRTAHHDGGPGTGAW